MRWTVLLVAALLVTAGCLGSDDEETPGEDEVPPPAAPTTRWSTETFQGEVTGATVPGGGGVSGGESNQADLTVPEGTRVLYLNVTTEGGDLDMQYGPDCQTEPAVSCANSATTEGGELNVKVDGPASGSWDVFFFIAEETAAGQVSWTLEVTVGVVPAA